MKNYMKTGQRLFFLTVLFVLPTEVSHAQSSFMDGAMERPNLYDEQSLIATVQYAYSRYQELAQVEGKGIRFHLSNFRTVRQAEFDTILWSDVETLEGGDSIRAGIITTDIGGLETVGLNVWWESLPNVLKTKTIAIYQKTTYGEKLRYDRRTYPEIRESPAALTSFNVTVSFEGKHRSYQAAFLWYDLNDGSLSDGYVDRISIADQVTAGVDQVATIPRRSESAPPSLKPTPVDKEPLAIRPKATCEVSDFITRYVIIDDGSTGHLSGNHSIDVSQDFKCTCRSDCSVKITMTSDSRGLHKTESGSLSLENKCHKLGIPGMNKRLIEPADASQIRPAVKVRLAGQWKVCTGDNSTFGICNCSVPPIQVSSETLAMTGYVQGLGLMDKTQDFFCKKLC